MRPIKLLRDQVLEMVSEFTFLFLITFLVFLQEEKNWNPVKGFVFLWMMVANGSVLIFVMIGKININEIIRVYGGNSYS